MRVSGAVEYLRDAPREFVLDRVRGESPRVLPLVDADYRTDSAHLPADLYAAFERVDLHATDVSKIDFRSFRDLVWSLVYARSFTDDLEIVRFAFSHFSFSANPSLLFLRWADLKC